MTYESWRISYQSSEAAARSAWQEMIRLHHRVNELEAQLSATHPTTLGLDAAVRELIDRLQDAQQDINLAANTHMSQQLASAAALLDEVESTLRALSATQPAAQGLDSAISESVLEAVKAINRGNGDGRAYRAALGWIVAHLNQAVARSLAVDPSGKVALPLATALAAQAKQKD